MLPLRVRYQTYEFGDLDIHVRTLRDTQEFRDEGGEAAELGISSAMWPLFGVVWGSGQALARLMVDFDVAGKRVLEVGCGIGLASLVLNHREADITATDLHPEAGRFLAKNATLNGGRHIPFVRTGWDDEDAVDDDLGTFDLIIGSDLLYERGHADALSGFISRHGRGHCEVLLLDPRRGNVARFRQRVVAQGYAYREQELAPVEPPEAPYSGQLLRFSR